MQASPVRVFHDGIGEEISSARLGGIDLAERPAPAIRIDPERHLLAYHGARGGNGGTQEGGGVKRSIGA